MSTARNTGAFLSAAALGAFAGAFAISATAFSAYLTEMDGSPLSAKLAAAFALHIMATLMMFVIACLIGLTFYQLLRRFGIANYLGVGVLGLAIGLIFLPKFPMLLGGPISACVFHWRYHKATSAGEQTKE